ncbi:hypothetical protein [Streptomyces sp. UG1]|uniref:hypothetical protein n=1 Tax=Streptomyces sp. UG1 TaxID=3417652 RepID=UPI003CF4AC67
MPTRLRNALSAALIALSCLLVPFGVLAAWVVHGLADTGRYVTTMAPLATDPAVRGAVADAVEAGVLRVVDDRPAGSSAPVRPFVDDAVRSFTRTEAFRTAWNTGNRELHSAVLRALRDERERAVTVDLAPITAQVKHRLTADHVPPPASGRGDPHLASLAHRLPVAHAEVDVLAADELNRLRKGYHVLEVAGFWLPVAGAVLAVTGIAIAACRRRAVMATALGTALGGAFLALAVVIGRRLTLADLPDAAHRPAAGAIYDALTATLRTVSWLLFTLGMAVALICRVTEYFAQRRRASGAAPTADPAPDQPRARV